MLLALRAENEALRKEQQIDKLDGCLVTSDGKTKPSYLAAESNGTVQTD